MLNSKAIKKFLNSRKNSLSENILLCLAITLASAFFQYDEFHGFMGIMRICVMVMLFVAWLWCAFLSGRDKKWGFLVFAGAYWLVPYLYILFYGARDNIMDYNAVITMLYKFADLLFEKPLLTISELTNCSNYIWVLSLIIMTGTVYFVGINTADIGREKVSENAEGAENSAEE